MALWGSIADGVGFFDGHPKTLMRLTGTDRPVDHKVDGGPCVLYALISGYWSFEVPDIF